VIVYHVASTQYCDDGVFRTTQFLFTYGLPCICLI